MTPQGELAEPYKIHVHSLTSTGVFTVPVTGKILRLNERMKYEPWTLSQAPEDVESNWLLEMEVVDEGLFDEQEFE